MLTFRMDKAGEKHANRTQKTVSKVQEKSPLGAIGAYAVALQVEGSQRGRRHDNSRNGDGTVGPDVVAAQKQRVDRLVKHNSICNGRGAVRTCNVQSATKD